VQDNYKMTFSRSNLSRAFAPRVSAAIAFFGLQSKAERDQIRREEDAAATRAYDYTRKTSKTVLSLIDTYRDEKVVPVAADALKSLKAQLDLCHKDASFDRVTEIQLEFADLVKGMAHAATVGVWDSLGDWNYTLIGTGLRDEFDRYISVTFGNIWKHVEERAKGEATYVVARISGHVTDEMHAARKKASRPNSR
jgi:hypothetical protein